MKLVNSFEDVEAQIGKEAIKSLRMDFFKYNDGTTEEDFQSFIVDQARQSQTGFDAPRYSAIIMAMVRATLVAHDNADRSQELALKLNDASNVILKDSDYTVIDVFSAFLSLAGSVLFSAVDESEKEHAKNCPDCSKRASDTTGFVRA